MSSVLATIKKKRKKKEEEKNSIYAKILSMVIS